MPEPAIPNRRAPTPALAFAALVLSALVFAGLWSRGSTQREALRDDPAEHTGRGTRVIWKEAGVNVSTLVLAADDRCLAGILYKSEIRSADDHLRQRVIAVDIESGQPLFDSLERHPIAICLADCGRSLAVLSDDIMNRRFILRMYEVRSGALTFEAEVPQGDAKWSQVFLGMSHDARIIAVLAWDAKYKEGAFAWNTETRKRVEFNSGNCAWSGQMISPDGQLLAHGGWPGPGIRISSARPRDDGSRSSVSFCLPDDGETWPAAAAWSPDSTRLLVVYRDGTLLDWRIAPGVGTLPARIGNEGEFQDCTGVALSYTRDQVFYAQRDGSIRARTLSGK